MELAEQKEITVGTMTKEDIASIKKADYVVFRYEKKEGDEQGRYILELGKEIKEKGFGGNYDRTTVTRQIKVLGHIENYDRSRGKDKITSIAMCHTMYKWDCDEVRTALEFVKEGDMVRLDFIVGNTSESMEKAGFQNDFCRLRIDRGKKRYCFRVANEYCNSSIARAVRYGAY